jgi:hypothetical protein
MVKPIVDQDPKEYADRNDEEDTIYKCHLQPKSQAF